MVIAYLRKVAAGHDAALFISGNSISTNDRGIRSDLNPIFQICKSCITRSRCADIIIHNFISCAGRGNQIYAIAFIAGNCIVFNPVARCSIRNNHPRTEIAHQLVTVYVRTDIITQHLIRTALQTHAAIFITRNNIPLTFAAAADYVIIARTINYYATKNIGKSECTALRRSDIIHGHPVTVCIIE